MAKKNKSQPTDAQLERERQALFSLKIVLNVLFALLIFQTFLILPRPDDPEFEYSSLQEILGDNSAKLLVMAVGLVLIATYWVQINKQLGNLVRSKPVHAGLCLLQMFCLMIYLYFVRFDMEFDGLQIALEMQSVFLAMAGFIGVFNWVYARANKLTSDQIDEHEEKHLLIQLLPEPIAALFSLPFAAISPEAWSLSFLIIIPLTVILNKIYKKRSKD